MIPEPPPLVSTSVTIGERKEASKGSPRSRQPAPAPKKEQGDRNGNSDSHSDNHSHSDSHSDGSSEADGDARGARDVGHVGASTAQTLGVIVLESIICVAVWTLRAAVAGQACLVGYANLSMLADWQSESGAQATAGAPAAHWWFAVRLVGTLLLAAVVFADAAIADEEWALTSMAAAGEALGLSRGPLRLLLWLLLSSAPLCDGCRFFWGKWLFRAYAYSANIALAAGAAGCWLLAACPGVSDHPWLRRSSLAVLAPLRSSCSAMVRSGAAFLQTERERDAYWTERNEWLHEQQRQQQLQQAELDRMAADLTAEERAEPIADVPPSTQAAALAVRASLAFSAVVDSAPSTGTESKATAAQAGSQARPQAERLQRVPEVEGVAVEHRQRLVEFYLKRGLPNKLLHMDLMLERMKGEENAMYAQLAAKYAVEDLRDFLTAVERDTLNQQREAQLAEHERTAKRMRREKRVRRRQADTSRKARQEAAAQRSAAAQQKRELLKLTALQFGSSRSDCCRCCCVGNEARWRRRARCAVRCHAFCVAHPTAVLRGFNAITGLLLVVAHVVAALNVAQLRWPGCATAAVQQLAANSGYTANASAAAAASWEPWASTVGSCIAMGGDGVTDRCGAGLGRVSGRKASLSCQRHRLTQRAVARREGVPLRFRRCFRTAVFMRVANQPRCLPSISCQASAAARAHCNVWRRLKSTVSAPYRPLPSMWTGPPPHLPESTRMCPAASVRDRSLRRPPSQGRSAVWHLAQWQRGTFPSRRRRCCLPLRSLVRHGRQPVLRQSCRPCRRTVLCKWWRLHPCSTSTAPAPATTFTVLLRLVRVDACVHLSV